MRSSGKGVVSIVPIVTLLSIGSAACVAPAFGADLAKGKKIYVDNCVECHGEKGKGDGPKAWMLSKKPANYTDKAVMSKLTDADLKKAVKDGRPPMPAWGGTLGEQAINDVIAYIRTFSK